MFSAIRIGWLLAQFLAPLLWLLTCMSSPCPEQLPHRVES
ncbi:hypothetical protein ABIA32_003007 [Streptacidiphilus sp. MAP12-20]